MSKRNTLSRVLIDMMMNVVNAGALVRPEQLLDGGKVELAVCVLMIDAPAIKRVGDALMEVIETLPTCPCELPPVDEGIGLKAFFELVDNVTQGWLGFGMRFGNTTVCAMMFRGEPCVQIGVICAQQRVPGIVTFLDEAASEELERKMRG